MGVKSGGKILHHVDNLSQDDLVTILRHRATTIRLRDAVPTIAYDANWLARKLASKKSSPAANILELVKSFRYKGVNSIIVVDGPTRHHSKKATIERDTVYEQKKLDTLILRRTLLQLVEQSRKPELPQEELVTIKGEIEKIEKTVTSNEKAIRARLLPDDFLDSLKDEVNKLKQDSGREGTVKVIQAKTQADLVIEHLAVTGIIDGAVANDCDFVVVAGKSMMLIKDFKLGKPASKKLPKSVVSIKLAAGFYSVLHEAVVTVLKMKADRIKKAAYDLLETDDFMLRAMIAVGLGCDTLPKGVKGLSVAKISSELKQRTNTSADELAAFYEKISFLPASLYKAFAMAVMFEPANELEVSESSSPIFVHGAPESFPEYLKEFGVGTTIPTNKTIGRETCCGSNKESKHIFATGEPTEKCSKCTAIVCTLCIGKRILVPDDDATKYCLPCLRGITFGEEKIPICDMRVALKRENVQDVGDLSILDVEELYDTLVVGKFNKITGEEKIVYPQLSTSSFDNDDTFSRVIPFQFSNGAQFLRAEDLSDDDVRQVVHLLSSLVTYSSLSKKSIPLYERSLPDIIVKFAKGSRIDGGYRLMKRANRHAMDPRCPSLLNASGAICFRDGISKPYMQIDTSVRASMKADFYKTKVCFSVDDLLCCGCECRSGSAGEEKNVCVHTPSAIQMLALLLLDGLVEHALCELAVRWKAPGPTFSTEQIDDLRCDLFRLMSITDATKYCGMVDRSKSVSELLSDFTVGTESAKAPPAPPPLDTVFLPMRSYNFKNPSQKCINKVKEKLERKEEMENIAACESSVEGESTDAIKVPNYEKIVASTDALYSFLQNRENNLMFLLDDSRQQSSSTIGNRLLNLRAAAVPKTMTTTDTTKMYDSLEEALNNTISRSRMDSGSKKRPTPTVLFESGDQPDYVRNRPAPKSLFTADSTGTVDDAPVKRRRRSERNKKQRPSGLVDDATVKQKKKSRSGPSGPRGAHTYCAFPKCHNNNGKKGLKFRRVSFGRTLTKPKGGSQKRNFMRYYKNIALRKKLLDRMGMAGLNVGKIPSGLRICSDHAIEAVTVPFKVSVFDTNNQLKNTTTHSVIYNLPKAEGIKMQASESQRSNRGVGNSRMKLSILESLGTISASGDGIESELAEARMEQQRAHEMNSKDSDIGIISPALQKASGLHVHETKSPSRGTKGKLKHAYVEKQTNTPRRKESIVTPFNLKPHQVKARTGFPDVAMLLSYVMIVCDGDISTVTSRVSSLTFFEEWMLYFEFIYGKTIPSVGAAISAYDIKDRNVVRNIVDKKMEMVKESRKRWPSYVTIAEDEQLRDSDWNEKYKGKRVVFWDNTGIDLHKPTDAVLQRLTYSPYYAGNVAKGGIYLQLCGWLGVHELYPGAMSDSDYLNKTDILRQQLRFQEGDGGVKFLNILDRGYRSTRAAWASGQLILQPTFAKSDKQFSTRDLIRSTSVAADRSGNERAVRVTKMSAYVKRGTQTHKNIDQLSDVWETWSYQSNFMYKPVL